LAVTGFDGAPKPLIAGNVLLPWTSVKISMRIPPTKNPEEAKEFILKKIQENPPYNAKVSIISSIAFPGFNAPHYE